MAKLIFKITALLVIFNLLFAGPASAKEFKITAKELKIIKTVLSYGQRVIGLAINDEKLTGVLKTSLEAGKIAGDISYGLMLLTTLSEAEFIDQVISQEYKSSANDYFNLIVDEKTNLGNHVKNVSFDILAAARSNISSPIMATGLETFLTTDKIISIFVSFNVLRQQKLYDGLWIYFDSRMNHIDHQESWELAKGAMGWAVDSPLLNSGILSGSGLTSSSFDYNYADQLELKFFGLFSKWERYIDKNGIKEEAKEKLAEETINVLEKAEKELPPKETLEDRLVKLFNRLKLLVQQSTDNSIGENAEDILAALPNKGAETDLITEKIKEIDSRQELTEKILGEEAIPLEEPSIPESRPVKDIQLELAEIEKQLFLIAEEIKQLQQTAPPPPKEEATSVATCRYQENVIFNEVAWMGSTVSSRDEWIELKNISFQNLDLEGWAITDLSQDINIVIGKVVLQPGELLLLNQYSGNLNNTSELLQLKSKDCLEDEINAQDGWPAGESETRKTMERLSDLSWQTSDSPDGTPGSENSPLVISPPGTIQGTETSRLLPEILISSVSSGVKSAKNEFVEIYNPTNSPITLSDANFKLKLVNSTNKVSKKTINWIRNTIPPKGYFLFVAGTIEGVGPDATFSSQLSKTGGAIVTGFYDDIKDRVSWGTNPPSEAREGNGKILTEGLKTNESLRRKDNQDTQDNEADFTLTSEIILHNSLGKTFVLENQEAVDPLKVSFKDIPSSFSTDSFKLEWVVETMEATVTPTDQDGIIIRFSEEDTPESWTYWPDENAWNQEKEYLFQGELGKTYHFQIKAHDSFENETEWTPEETLTVSLSNPSKKVVINEVGWMGTSDSRDEWLELFNNQNEPVDIYDWSIFGADTGKCLNFKDADIIANSVIPGKGFLLYVRYPNTVKDGNDLADITDSSIGLNNTKPGFLGLYDSGDCQGNLIDSLNNGNEWFAGKEAGRYSMEKINPSFWGDNPESWVDNNGMIRNGSDWQEEPLNATPKKQNSGYQEAAPQKIVDLTITETTLSWTAPLDLDTDFSNLSYDIRYLPEEELNEGNWEKALSIDNEPLVQEGIQTLTINAPGYERNYYFGIKTTDQSLTSELSNIAVLRVSSSGNPLWPMVQYDKKRSGKVNVVGPDLSSSQLEVLSDRPAYSLVIGADGTIYGGNNDEMFSLDPLIKEYNWIKPSFKSVNSISIGPLGELFVFYGNKLARVDNLGNKEWEIPLPVSYQGLHPVLTENYLYFLNECNINYSLFKIDFDGNLIWIFDSVTEQLLSSLDCGPEHGWGSGEFPLPAIDDSGNIYFGHEKILYSVSSSGTLNWKRVFSQPVTTPLPDSYLYLGHGFIDALDLSSGNSLWPEDYIEVNGVTPLAKGNDSLFFHRIYAGIVTETITYSIQANANINWQHDPLIFTPVTSPLVDQNETLYFGTTKGIISFAKNGEISGEYLLSKIRAHFLILRENSLYFGGDKVYLLKSDK